MRSALPLLLLVASLALVAPAAAATVSSEVVVVHRDDGGRYQDQPYDRREGRITFVAEPGAQDGVTGRYDVQAGTVELTDTAGAAPGPGCAALAPTTVRCDVGDLLVGGDVKLGDGDDTAQLGSGFVVDGGPGDDRLEGAATLLGGDGADVLHGRGTMDGGAGPDVMQGSGANAGVSYAERTAGVRVTVAAGAADDGEPGEGDEVSGSITSVVGGAGDDVLQLGAAQGSFRRLDGRAGADTLTGAAGSDSLDGGEGDDLLHGGGGDDVLEGGPGTDDLRGDDGDDVLLADTSSLAPAASPGGDRLLGGPGADRLVGSPAADTLDAGRGRDVVEGSGGDDRVLARDRSLDLVTCARAGGDPAGIAALDGRDLARRCRSVERAGAPRAQPLLAGPPELGRGLAVALGCPQDATGGCRIGLRLVGGAVRVGRLTTTLQPGRARQVRLRLSAPRQRLVPRRRPPPGTARFCGFRRLTLITTSRVAGAAAQVRRDSVEVGSSALACPFGSVDRYDTGWPSR